MSGLRLHEQAPAERWITADQSERAEMLRWELKNCPTHRVANPKQLDAIIGDIRSHGLILQGSFDACVEMGKRELARKQDYVTPDGLRRHEVPPEEKQRVRETAIALAEHERKDPIVDTRYRKHRERGHGHRFRSQFVR